MPTAKLGDLRCAEQVSGCISEEAGLGSFAAFLVTLLRGTPFVLADIFFLLVVLGLLFFTTVRFVAARALVAERALVAARTFFAERAFVVLRFFVVALPGFRLDRVALADAVRWDVAASSAF